MSGTLATDGPAPDAGSTAALSALILEVAGVATLYPPAPWVRSGRARPS